MDGAFAVYATFTKTARGKIVENVLCFRENKGIK